MAAVFVVCNDEIFCPVANEFIVGGSALPFVDVGREYGVEGDVKVAKDYHCSLLHSSCAELLACCLTVLSFGYPRAIAFAFLPFSLIALVEEEIAQR